MKSNPITPSHYDKQPLRFILESGSELAVTSADRVDNPNSAVETPIEHPKLGQEELLLALREIVELCNED